MRHGAFFLSGNELQYAPRWEAFKLAGKAGGKATEEAEVISHEC
jgi:hypothetical protein